MKVYEVAGGWGVGDGTFFVAIFPTKGQAEEFERMLKQRPRMDCDCEPYGAGQHSTDAR